MTSPCCELCLRQPVHLGVKICLDPSCLCHREKNYEQDYSHFHCFDTTAGDEEVNGQEGHEKHLKCCLCYKDAPTKKEGDAIDSRMWAFRLQPQKTQMMIRGALLQARKEGRTSALQAVREWANDQGASHFPDPQMDHARQEVISAIQDCLSALSKVDEE